MQKDEINIKVQLLNIFPLYKHAVNEIMNQHSMINGIRFRDVVLKLAKIPGNFMEINQFVKELNMKIINVNSPNHLKRFTQLLSRINQDTVPTLKKPKKPKRDADEDVDDK